MTKGRWIFVTSCLAGALVAALPTPIRAAEKGKVAVEKVEYKGWKNNLKISDGNVELIVTLDVGPRIIHYGLVGGKNVFKTYDDQLGKSGENKWMIRGGHRLWVAPEDTERTYALDNAPVRHEEKPELRSVLFFAPPEKAFGLEKTLGVFFLPTDAGTGTSTVQVFHQIANVGDKATELAPWALTVMAPGGTEIIPLPEKKPHPQALLPNQLMVIWPYVDFKDPRWSFGSKYITLKQDAGRGATKIGLAHKSRWVGYLNSGALFVKYFEYKEGQTYPDYGCNFETFTNQDMLEVETLGPLVKLAPGERIGHTEWWELHKDIGPITDEESIDKHILPKIAKPAKKPAKD